MPSPDLWVMQEQVAFHQALLLVIMAGQQLMPLEEPQRRQLSRHSPQVRKHQMLEVLPVGVGPNSDRNLTLLASLKLSQLQVVLLRMLLQQVALRPMPLLLVVVPLQMLPLRVKSQILQGVPQMPIPTLVMLSLQSAYLEVVPLLMPLGLHALLWP